MTRRPGLPARAAAASLVLAVAALPAVGGCRDGSSTGEVAGLAGTRWALAAFEPPDRPPATPTGAITLAFGAEHDEVKGSAGCNLFRADYRLDGVELALSPIDTSRMICGSGRIMADERDFVLALESAGRLERAGDALWIDAAGGWRLRFARAGDAGPTGTPSGSPATP